MDYTVTGSGGDQADAEDFVGDMPSGTVNFADGEASKLITVNVAGDTAIEADEGFTVTISNPANSETITTASAVGTIQKDDTGLAIDATDAAKAEGDIGDTEFTFTVIRSGNTTGDSSVKWEIGRAHV